MIVEQPNSTGVLTSDVISGSLPGAIVQSPIHAHPPNGLPSRADYLYVLTENVPLQIVQRVNGKPTILTISPDDAIEYFLKNP